MGCVWQTLQCFQSISWLFFALVIHSQRSAHGPVIYKTEASHPIRAFTSKRAVTFAFLWLIRLKLRWNYCEWKIEPNHSFDGLHFRWIIKLGERKRTIKTQTPSLCIFNLNSLHHSFISENSDGSQFNFKTKLSISLLGVKIAQTHTLRSHSNSNYSFWNCSIKDGYSKGFQE